MRDMILNELDVLEQERGVKVLLAIESGSRSWGFASTDSDYDVRYVYIKPTSEYLRLENTRDTMEWRLDDELDIVGWDLSKFLRLLRKSNPSAFEWLGSEIVYREIPAFQRVRDVAKKCFDPFASANHYLGMATKHDFRYIKSGKPTLKRYLYAVRAILACRWSIYEQTPVPIPFEALERAMIDENMVTLIDGMVEEKKTKSESALCGQIPELDSWIETNMELLRQEIGLMKRKRAVDWPALDRIFLDCLYACL